MHAMWKSDIPPTPETGPLWPGDFERLSYRGLTVQPETDLEVWDTSDDVWEVSVAATGDLLISIRADRDRALEIATRLADAKDWTAIAGPLSWSDIAFDPLVLRLMADYPGIIGLPVISDDGDWGTDIPYGDE